MAKQIVFDEEARHYLKKGIDTLADAVKITLGPRGGFFCLIRPRRSPRRGGFWLLARAG